jgi:hypothetical protein
MDGGSLEAAAAGVDDGAGGEDDTQNRIAAFREQRELRRVRGTRLIVSLAFLIGFVGLWWAEITQDHNPLPFIPDADEWAVGYLLNNVGLALAYIAADTLDFEKLWGELQIAELRSDLASSALALSTKVVYFYLIASQVPSLFKKYGWLLLYGYIWLWLVPALSLALALTKGQLNVFAPAVTAERPFLERKPTVCEWYAVYTSLTFLMYVGADAEMWSRNQWEAFERNGGSSAVPESDGLLGPTLSPIVAILASLCGGARFVHRWALRAFEQEPPEWFQDPRPWLFGSLWMQFNIHLGVVLLVRAAVQPENQTLMGNNLDLFETLGISERRHWDWLHWTWQEDIPTPRANNREGIALVGAVFVIVPSIAFRYRSQIYELLIKSFNKKQRLLDGAFIAALLDDGSTNDGDGDGSDLIADSAALIRRVPMRHVSLAMLQASPRDPSYDSAQSFALGESCGLGGVDFFVSHSWSDCPKQKFTQLCAVALDFYRKNGREPTFWL